MSEEIRFNTPLNPEVRAAREKTYVGSDPYVRLYSGSHYDMLAIPEAWLEEMTDGKTIIRTSDIASTLCGRDCRDFGISPSDIIAKNHIEVAVAGTKDEILVYRRISAYKESTSIKRQIISAHGTTTRKTKMLESQVEMLLPFATKEIKAKYKTKQKTVLCKVYEFRTGKKIFSIVHEYAVIYHEIMLDMVSFIDQDPMHLNSVEKPYYSNEYFFYAESLVNVEEENPF